MRCLTCDHAILSYVMSYCIVLYLYISIALLTARAFQERSRPQQLTLCRSLHAEALQAVAGKGLAQGPYMAARAGFEPTTLRSNRVVSTNAPPCPTIAFSLLCCVYVVVRCKDIED